MFDLYCPDPACDCSDVTVAFIDRHGEAGSVQVDLSSGAVHFDHDSADEGLLAGLWGRFVQRHRGISLLVERDRRIAAYGERLFAQLAKQKPPAERRRPVASQQATAAPGRTGAKLGRNDPCACGSGKKYKRCCLPRLSP